MFNWEETKKALDKEGIKELENEISSTDKMIEADQNKLAAYTDLYNFEKSSPDESIRSSAEYMAKPVVDHMREELEELTTFRNYCLKRIAELTVKEGEE